MFVCVFFFQAEDGIRDLVRSRGLGDVYKRQRQPRAGLDGYRGADSDLPYHGAQRLDLPASGEHLSLIHI